MTINRNDFDPEVFDTFMRDTLWDELTTVEVELAEMHDAKVDENEIQSHMILQAALCRVVAYHSTPGSFRGGVYDGE
ncbi:MAG TPA: hypothetical protein EYQ21_02405 [Flavobacteriales bacterium]|nr:hypothetical protein [Flavobacteriales bacterium]